MLVVLVLVLLVLLLLLMMMMINDSNRQKMITRLVTAGRTIVCGEYFGFSLVSWPPCWNSAGCSAVLWTGL